MENPPAHAAAEKEKENPKDLITVQPSGNHLMQEQAIDGLLGALELRNGKLDAVSRNDILNATNMLPPTFDHYYRDASGIMKDVYKNLRGVFTKMEQDIVGLPEDEKLYFLFERLWRQKKSVKIILLIEDHDVWKNYMRNMFRGIAQSWEEFDDAQWAYLYGVFCGQFESVLKKWDTVGLKKEYIHECVRLTSIWIEADAMLGETAGDLIGKWV